jgi:hypothetical protein
MTVRANGFDAHETTGKLVEGAVHRKGNYLATFRCAGEGVIRLDKPE